jgi:trehalose-phosphatase
VTGSDRSRDSRYAGTFGERLDGSPLALMFDIDGTLAPIAPTPDAAVVPPETRDVLRQLAELPEVQVALVSGRSVADALRMLHVERVWIVGNHGLELRNPAGEVSVAPDAHPYEAVIEAAANALAPIARSAPGALVENKRWTVSLHYRLVDPGEVDALVGHAEDLARELGLRVTYGKKIIELRPPIEIDKGTATTALAQRVGALEGGCVLYAGDDQTDEDAFRALRAATVNAVTVRVMTTAVDYASTPTAAEFVLASPEELRGALEWLVARRTR